MHMSLFISFCVYCWDIMVPRTNNTSKIKFEYYHQEESRLYLWDVGVTTVPPMLTTHGYTQKHRRLNFRQHLHTVPDSKLHGANMGPIWADMTQVGPMLAPWILLSGVISAVKTSFLASFVCDTKWLLPSCMHAEISGCALCYLWWLLMTALRFGQWPEIMGSDACMYSEKLCMSFHVMSVKKELWWS